MPFEPGIHTLLAHLTNQETPEETLFFQREKGMANGLVLPSTMKHFHVLFMQSGDPFPLQPYKLHLL